MKQHNNSDEHYIEEEDYNLCSLEGKLSNGCWDDEIEEEFGIKFYGSEYDQ